MTLIQNLISRFRSPAIARPNGGDIFSLATITSGESLRTSCRFGSPQYSGAMALIPILGTDAGGDWTSPLSGLKFTGVHGYGNVSFRNDGKGTAILPLHIGFIQDGAQNHALSRSAMLAPGQSVKFEDARCVQAAQGGYLESAEQWFFILPLQLREEALNLRHKPGCGLLWPAISRLSVTFGEPNRGHLDQIVCRKRAQLNQYVNRFELLRDQIGAIYFLDNRLAGIEIAPSVQYFAEIWTAVTCFCYGTAALYAERKAAEKTLEKPERCETLTELRTRLQARREARDARLLEAISSVKSSLNDVTEEERMLDLSLCTVKGAEFSGQLIRRRGELMYASIFRCGYAV